MTENRRFYYAHGIVWDSTKSNGLNGISINDLDRGLRFVNWLNELSIENEQLKKERMIWLESQEEFECLSEENEQLKERNNRQAQTIDELWSLIVANDWTKLKEMVEEDKKNEELLHREFKCYEGDNND